MVIVSIYLHEIAVFFGTGYSITSYQKSIIQNGKQSQISSSLNVSQPSSFLPKNNKHTKHKTFSRWCLSHLRGFLMDLRSQSALKKFLTCYLVVYWHWWWVLGRNDYIKSFVYSQEIWTLKKKEEHRTY